MWLIVSSLSPHNLHLLFCCILSILALIWLVLMALFCTAIRRDSVSLLRFPFFSHVHIFSCEMSLVSRLKHPYSCFSSHFYFLVIFILLIFVLSVLFLVVVISLPLINTSTLFSMLASLLPPSFLVIYSLSTSSLRCKALWIIISFLVLWSICSSSLISIR